VKKVLFVLMALCWVSSLAFAAEYDGKIVGAFFAGIKPWWDGNHLFDGEIFVHPDFQNKKIGKALFKRILEEAVKKYDAKIFDAFTFNGSEFASGVYFYRIQAGNYVQVKRMVLIK